MNFYTRKLMTGKMGRELHILYFAAIALLIVLLFCIFFIPYLLVNGARAFGSTYFHLLLWLIALACVVTLAISHFSSYFLKKGPSDKVAKDLDARPIGSEVSSLNEQKLVFAVEKMAVKANVPVPKVHVMDDESGINSMCVGTGYLDSSIVVTDGAISLLDRDELMALVAYEITRIQDGSARFSLELAGYLKGFRWMGPIGNVLSVLIKEALLEQKEYERDEAAIELLGDEDAYLRTLMKIIAYENGSIVLEKSAKSYEHAFFAAHNKKRSSFAEPFGAYYRRTPFERVRKIRPEFSANSLTPIPRTLYYQSSEYYQKMKGSFSSGGSDGLQLGTVTSLRRNDGPQAGVKADAKEKPNYVKVGMEEKEVVRETSKRGDASTNTATSTSTATSASTTSVAGGGEARNEPSSVFDNSATTTIRAEKTVSEAQTSNIADPKMGNRNDNLGAVEETSGYSTRDEKEYQYGSDEFVSVELGDGDELGGSMSSFSEKEVAQDGGTASAPRDMASEAHVQTESQIRNQIQSGGAVLSEGGMGISPNQPQRSSKINVHGSSVSQGNERRPIGSSRPDSSISPEVARSMDDFYFENADDDDVIMTFSEEESEEIRKDASKAEEFAKRRMQDPGDGDVAEMAMEEEEESFEWIPDEEPDEPAAAAPVSKRKEAGAKAAQAFNKAGAKAKDVLGKMKKAGAAKKPKPKSRKAANPDAGSIPQAKANDGKANTPKPQKTGARMIFGKVGKLIKRGNRFNAKARSAEGSVPVGVEGYKMGVEVPEAFTLTPDMMSEMSPLWYVVLHGKDYKAAIYALFLLEMKGEDAALALKDMRDWSEDMYGICRNLLDSREGIAPQSRLNVAILALSSLVNESYEDFRDVRTHIDDIMERKTDGISVYEWVFYSLLVTQCEHYYSTHRPVEVKNFKISRGLVVDGGGFFSVAGRVLCNFLSIEEVLKVSPQDVENELRIVLSYVAGYNKQGLDRTDALTLGMRALLLNPALMRPAKVDFRAFNEALFKILDINTRQSPCVLQGFVSSLGYQGAVSEDEYVVVKALCLLLRLPTPEQIGI